MKQKWLFWGIPLVALILGIWLALNLAAPSNPQHLSSYPQPRKLAEVELVNAQGDTVKPGQWLEGQWTLAFTGYTYCPDICPTTMAALNRIYEQLQQLPSDQPIRVLFVSVDPKRDTPERLAEYGAFFNSEFQAVTGPHKELFPFVRSLGMMYAMSQSTDDNDYLVDHSGSVVLLNPKAQVVGRFKPESRPGQLAVVNPNHILADMPVLVD
ncbi:Protein SCO1 like protein, mitochondrial [Saliniradius amylolyticus]|uniref:Protein SCO1 like protein, mitochondrial n=1 Tax=Saliniradius amylolyticus TaxID=2183582 RepID=A0A2S2DZZ3_9ALTE|nr:SCO family protein [Saliniradius amylolyticus]AWL10590.1 Protein SCO1 like protein, mitochondrial [Saliniradius amylolyticus]